MHHVFLQDWAAYSVSTVGLILPINHITEHVTGYKSDHPLQTTDNETVYGVFIMHDQIGETQ